MKKNLSYREKLLELGTIYKISEIQNYNKRKRNLNTQQIEQILRKNNAPLPKDFKVNFFKKILTNKKNQFKKKLKKEKEKDKNSTEDIYPLW